MEYFERTAGKHLLELSRHFPVVVVTGARQTGKTTLIKRTFGSMPNINYVTLDYPVIRALAQNDPELFLQQYPAPLIIDEVQYAPQLFPYLKIRVDENRTNCQYFLTGSQMFHLMKDVSESLAGRVGIVPLYGFSRAEIEQRSETVFLPSNLFAASSKETLSSVFNQICRGSMPQMIVDETLTAENYYGAYLQTYIERDIRGMLEVKKEVAFVKYVSCVATRTGQELNVSDMARDVGIDTKTAENWLSLLVTSGLVFLLRPYSKNTIKRIVKRPKLYFVDTGLACYLSQWNNPRALEQSAMAGAMFETYVIAELLKQYTNAGLDIRSRFSYYRDNNGNEIDLIITQNGVNYPIEIKKCANPDKDAVKHFKILQSLGNAAGEGAVICLSPYTYPIDSLNKAIPIDVI